MNIRVIVLLLFFVLIRSTAFNQLNQPYYFVLGENEFKGVQIYDVIQDKKLNYWFSTNEGLVYYDHYNYLKVVCNESRSVSYFNFAKNSKGEIFCNNLNRQIFKIEDKKCKLIYEVSEKYANSFISLTTTPTNELILACDAIILLDSNGKELEILNNHIGMSGIPFNMSNGDVLMSLGTDSLAIFKNGKLRYQKLNYHTLENNDAEMFYFFEINNHLFGITNRSKSIVEIDYTTYNIKQLPKNVDLANALTIRVYQTENHVWIAGTLPGVFYLTYENNVIKTHSFYPDKYVSDVYLDNEGNFIMSTFNQGSLVIQDLKIADDFFKIKNETITSIQKFNDGKIIFGSSGGKLGIIENDSVKIVHDKGIRPIDQIVVPENSEYIIFDDGAIKIYDLKNNEIEILHQSSLKDGVILNNESIFLSTNTGLLFFEKAEDNIYQKQLNRLAFRTYAVAFSHFNKTLYISTVYGLYAMKNDSIFELKNNNTSIYASSLTYQNNKIYATQSNSNLVVIDHLNKVSQISLPNYEEPLVIYKLVFQDSLAFANSSQGLFIYNTNNQKIDFINRSYGIPKRPLIDFDVQKNFLWVSSSEGFRRIDLNYANKSIDKPQLSLKLIKVNDVITPIEKMNNFNSNERKISFTLSTPSLKYKHAIKYKYQLDGFEEQWHFNDYNENIITYNSLPSGDFIFKAQAVNGEEASEILQFKFTIASPFYQRLWFIILCILTFIFIVSIIYKRQLRIQKTKSNQLFELNASKLTAIQSQMNPHFIFNSLNSIQDLVLKGDIEHSYSYITTFSNLVRRTLTYSDKDFIDFEEEIKLIELYLLLEKLRFKNDLICEINYQEITDILIPPMLIQPFIENALVHGLLHKKSDKKITINFKLNDSLYCIIEDNGVGRKKATEIQERQRKNHESFAVQAIRKRFEILSNYYQGELGYQYEDLYENGLSVGTRVTLKIPFKNKF